MHRTVIQQWFSKDFYLTQGCYAVGDAAPLGQKMPIKVLFIDTSALIKMFIAEDGSNTMKWLTNSSTKVVNSLHFVINNQVCEEFVNKIKDFEKYNKISKAKSDETIRVRQQNL